VFVIFFSAAIGIIVKAVASKNVIRKTTDKELGDDNGSH
jgi:hypothetical protein